MGSDAPHLTGDGAGFLIKLWQGSNSDKQTQTSNNKTIQTQLKRGVYTSGWVVLLACLTSVHTNLSFVPVSKTTLLLPTLSCLHAPLTPCNRGSKPPLIKQIILVPSGRRSCRQTQIYTQNKGWKTCTILLCHCVWNMASMEAVCGNGWARGCSEGQARCENPSCFQGRSVTMTHQNYMNQNISVTFLATWVTNEDTIDFVVLFLQICKLEPDRVGFICLNSSFCLLYMSVAKSSCTAHVEIWPTQHDNVSFLPQTPFKNDWGDGEKARGFDPEPSSIHTQHNRTQAPNKRRTTSSSLIMEPGTGHRSSSTGGFYFLRPVKEIQVSCCSKPLAGYEIQMAWRLQTAPAPATVNL